MFKGLLGGLNQRKVKVFFLFLLCSLFAWTLSQLSENYNSRANFELQFFNFPDSLLLKDAEPLNIDLKLNTSGFKFFGYGLSTRKLRVDVSEIERDDKGYYLSENVLKPQFEKQFSNNVSLIELGKRRIYVPLYKVVTKAVPISPNITLDLEPNHILEGTLVLDPPQALLKGPIEEVGTMGKIQTAPYIFEGLNTSFTKTLAIEKPQGLANTVLLTNTVVIQGEVVRFSEKEFTISVETTNEPQGYKIRTFPKEVQLICKASVERLKRMKPTDFQVIVDYSNATSGKNTLLLNVARTPEGTHAVTLIQKEVEFVLEQL